MMQTHDGKEMAEEEMENDEAASAKPDGAHTRQDLDWAWHMITKQHSLRTQANALAQQNREESRPVRGLRRTEQGNNAAQITAAVDSVDASTQLGSDAGERAESADNEASEANDNTSGDRNDVRVDEETNDAAEGAGDTSDSDCDANATDGDFDEDDGFRHVDDVADEIHADSAASHKRDYYSVLYDTVERVDRAEASNHDEDEEDVEDHLDYDSRNEDEGEAAGEQFYRPGSVPHADSGDDLESPFRDEPQHNPSSINLARPPTKRIESESQAVSSQATTALHLSDSTRPILRRATESQPQVRHSSCQKLLRKRGAESQYGATDKRTRR